VPLHRTHETRIKIFVEQVPNLHGTYSASARSRRMAPIR
jgi:hypothetical protein